MPDLTCLLFHVLPSFKCATASRTHCFLGTLFYTPLYLTNMVSTHTHTPEKANVFVRLVLYLRLYALFTSCKFNT